MSAFDESPALHIPDPPYEGDERELDHNAATFASWIEYATLCYPKFLATEDFDAVDELDAFFRTLGALLLCCNWT